MCQLKLNLITENENDEWRAEEKRDTTEEEEEAEAARHCPVSVSMSSVVWLAVCHWVIERVRGSNGDRVTSDTKVEHSAKERRAEGSIRPDAHMA